ncbi:MAG: ABC transporter permease [Candidatus Saccharimonadales bacterium]
MADFKIRYQNSVLGYIWSLLRPLLLFLILYVVFVLILKTGGDVPHFGVYLLLGIVLWNYFVEVTMGSVGAVVGKGDLMRKVNFPRYVVVLAGSFSALINLMFNILVVTLFMWLGHAEPNKYALFLPLLILELFVFSLSIGFFLSAAYVRYRDINYIWEVLIQIAFYAAPILYAFSYISNKSRIIGKLVMINPIAQIIQDFRRGLITDKTTTIAGAFHTNYAYLLPISIVIIFGVLSVIYFRKKSPYFAEDV